MKKKEMQLSNYCRWNDNRSLVKLLKQHADLDLTITDGVCFSLAIKHNNVDMLNTLLDYYKKTKLQGDHDNMEYKVASYKLRQILHNVIDSFEVSSEIQESLNPYIRTTEDSDDEQDLSGFEEDRLVEGVHTEVEMIGDSSGAGQFHEILTD